MIFAVLDDQDADETRLTRCRHSLVIGNTRTSLNFFNVRCSAYCRRRQNHPGFFQPAVLAHAIEIHFDEFLAVPFPL
jgi:hypothetical protein